MTYDEFIDWKNDRRTMEVYAHLLAHRLAALEDMSDPSIINTSNMALRQARYIGYIEGLEATLEFKVEKEEDGEASTRSQDSD